MTYTADKPPLAETSDDLRARIPGWGADLDPKDRPSVPKLRFDPNLSGAHWAFPDLQLEKWPRERSIEHAFLTPVFGTSCPPRGVSGVMRRFAYNRYSEARATHWLLLLAADHVDAVEHHLRSFLTLRPDNPITETGVRSELSSSPISSRFGQKRTDLVHQPLDPVIIAGPWVVAPSWAPGRWPEHCRGAGGTDSTGPRTPNSSHLFAPTGNICDELRQVRVEPPNLSQLTFHAGDNCDGSVRAVNADGRPLDGISH